MNTLLQLFHQTTPTVHAFAATLAMLGLGLAGVSAEQSFQLEKYHHNS